MNWARYGPQAVVFRFAERVGDEAFAKGRAIAAELERRPPPGMIEFVPSFTTVLVTFAGEQQALAAAPELARRLDGCSAPKGSVPQMKEIPVIYDGPDLGRVAEGHGLTIGQVAELHSKPTYKVYLLGFSPGFPYLGDLDSRLHTPRLTSPRPRVSAGSVAIGGSHTGVYSVDGPGGWNIIGRTTVKLFDAGKDGREMFFLQPGDLVRFVAEAS